MTVVSAGMHDPRNPGRILAAGVFLHRKPIYIRPQGNAGTFPISLQKCRQSCLQTGIQNLQPHLFQLFSDIRCCLKLSLIHIFIGFPLFANVLGGTNKTWAAVAALYASWVGGSGNMAAMQAALPVDAGAYSCALALDTVCYSLWIALLLLAVRYAKKWNSAVKADTSKLDAVAEAANAELSKDNKKATYADWVFLIGLSLMVSALSQIVGAAISKGLASMGLTMFCLLYTSRCV